MGAAVLVAGVLQVRATHHFLAVYLGTGSDHGMKEIANAVSTAVGGYWTFVLAGMYVPAAARLKTVLAAAARGQVEQETPERVDAWLRERGLTLSLGHQVARLAALLGPLLAGGPLNTLLQFVSSN